MLSSAIFEGGVVLRNPCARNNVKLIGVAGGSGSGKTYFARYLARHLGESHCLILSQDNFYRDLSIEFKTDPLRVNFDHPDSIDFELLAEALRLLKARKTAQAPIYDFVSHSRLDEQILLEPKPVVIVDGILIFHIPELRELFDERVYVDTPEDLRFQRRLLRDMRERGRTAESVHKQFFSQVKPMHDLYVEPSKLHAHRMIRDEEAFLGTIDYFAEQMSLELGDRPSPLSAEP